MRPLRLGALLLALLAGCGKVGPLSLPEGTAPPNVASDVLVIDQQTGITVQEPVDE